MRRYGRVVEGTYIAGLVEVLEHGSVDLHVDDLLLYARKPGVLGGVACFEADQALLLDRARGRHSGQHGDCIGTRRIEEQEASRAYEVLDGRAKVKQKVLVKFAKVGRAPPLPKFKFYLERYSLAPVTPRATKRSRELARSGRVLTSPRS